MTLNLFIFAFSKVNANPFPYNCYILISENMEALITSCLGGEV